MISINSILNRAVRRSVAFMACLGWTQLPALGESTARRWNEVILSAIRVDVPHPPAHARNLFHLSVAMWDAWAAYDAVAVGYLHREHAVAQDVEAARREAISYAAYRILMNRFANSVGAATSLPAFTARLVAEGGDPANTTTTGATPAAVGNRVAQTLLAWAGADGSNQAAGYADPTYIAANPPMILALGGTTATNPNRWQPLAFSLQVTQNGIVLPSAVQKCVGAGWRNTRPFALERELPQSPWMAPGAPPQMGGTTDGEYKRQHFEVLKLSGRLGVPGSAMVNISPSAVGNNPLGFNSGAGHPLNPVTGQPYPANEVLEADFGRVLTEYWADGPHSETPPGHWNVIANQVADHPLTVKRFGGTGPVLGDLEWDVKVYLALNAAVHDAACTAWTLKRYFDSARPITAIRYMAQKGQSTDPVLPSWHPQGLPLLAGVSEVITPSSAATGQRHAHLADHLGEIAVRGWAGEPADPANTTAGVVWMLGKNWLPYQRRTFVTPAFPGYISGHSTFSRAAAEVMTAVTGSPFFPGGISTYTVPVGHLLHEEGPTQDVTLQWATYYDAADQAGQSRLWGGIHIETDDFDGRICGSRAGLGAWDLARRYFDGSILSEEVSPEMLLEGGTCTVSWPCRRGLNYRLQCSQDLSTWTDVVPFHTALDTRYEWQTTASGRQREFFRVTKEQ